MANSAVWENTTAGDGTPANSFEMLLEVLMGAVRRRTADITNLNPQTTAITRARQNYAQKGRASTTKIGDDVVVSWDHEAIRDDNGQFQPELQYLLDASKADGQANLVELRIFDALGADYALEGRFSITVARTATDWNSAAAFTITATLYDRFAWIENPVLEGLVPSIAAVLPAAAVTGSTLFIQGDNLTGATAVTIGGTAATAVSVKGASLLTATVPAGTAGSAPIKVTSPAGESEPFAYVRGGAA